MVSHYLSLSIILFCLGILGAIGAMVVLRLAGTERVSGWVLARYARLKDENPEKAERLRLKAARLSAMASAIAARLPESWVQGLYLPDFEPAGELPEKMRSINILCAILKILSSAHRKQQLSTP